MSSTKIDFLYLNEEEMVKAGVTDMHRCVEVMGEVFDLMGRGDPEEITYINAHGTGTHHNDLFETRAHRASHMIPIT